MAQSVLVRRTHRDRGFTLLEIATVLLIAGVLSAVAVPVLLSKRSSGTDASVKTDVQGAVQVVETWITSNPFKAIPTETAGDPGVSALAGFEPSGANVIELWPRGDQQLGSYCVSGYNPQGSAGSEASSLVYDSTTETITAGGTTAGCVPIIAPPPPPPEPTPTATPPPPPPTLPVLDCTTNGVSNQDDDATNEVNWTPVADAESYAVFARSGGSGSGELDSDGHTSAPVYIAKHATHNEYRVVPVADGYESPTDCEWFPGLALPQPLGCPVATSTSVNVTNNEVTWAPVDGADNYTISARTGTGSATVVAATASSGHQVTKHNTNNFYQVNAEGAGAYPSTDCPWISADVKPTLACPTNITAVRFDASFDDLDWDPVAGATTYRIFWASAPSGAGTFEKSTAHDDELVAKTIYQRYYRLEPVASGYQSPVCGYTTGPTPDPAAPSYGDAKPATTAPYAVGNGTLTCPHVTITVTYLGWDPTGQGGAGDHRYRIYNKFTAVTGAATYWTGQVGNGSTKIFPVKNNGSTAGGGYTTAFDYNVISPGSDWFHYTPHAYNVTGAKNSAGCSGIALRLPRTLNQATTVNSTTSS